MNKKKQFKSSVLFAHIHHPISGEQLRLYSAIHKAPSNWKNELRVDFPKEVIIIDSNSHKYTKEEVAEILKDQLKEQEDYRNDRGRITQGKDELLNSIPNGNGEE